MKIATLYATSELKAALTERFSPSNMESVYGGGIFEDLQLPYTADRWQWLQDYYVFPNQVKTASVDGEQMIIIPFAG